MIKFALRRRILRRKHFSLFSGDEGGDCSDSDTTDYFASNVDDSAENKTWFGSFIQNFKQKNTDIKEENSKTLDKADKTKLNKAKLEKEAFNDDFWEVTGSDTLFEERVSDLLDRLKLVLEKNCSSVCTIKHFELKAISSDGRQFSVISDFGNECVNVKLPSNLTFSFRYYHARGWLSKEQQEIETFLTTEVLASKL